MKFVVALTLVAILCGAAMAIAQTDKKPPGPPPEAIEACSGLSAGDACSFESPHGTVEGTCRSHPDKDELACAPKGHRGGPPPDGPPPDRD